MGLSAESSMVQWDFPGTVPAMQDCDVQQCAFYWFIRQQTGSDRQGLLEFRFDHLDGRIHDSGHYSLSELR